MAEKKITKKEKFNMLLGIAEVASNPVLKEFCESELALLEKKNAAKSTRSDPEKERLMRGLYEAMAPRTLYTATEMSRLPFPASVEMTPQRAVNLCKILIAKGYVENEKSSKGSFYMRISGAELGEE
jgi:hypothetical protein